MSTVAALTATVGILHELWPFYFFKKLCAAVLQIAKR